MRKIIFSLSLSPVVKEYGIIVRLLPGCHNVSGRCWKWLSGSWVCYGTMALHWLLRIMKQNDAQYNRRNRRCCKPCLYQVPISLQCSIPDDGHRSCSVSSCMSSTQPQGVWDYQADALPNRFSIYHVRAYIIKQTTSVSCIICLHRTLMKFTFCVVFHRFFFYHVISPSDAFGS